MQDSRIVSINIEEELKVAYIDYSMSVIVSRALPDVRDGLKPVHRRVLYGMLDLGLAYNKPYKKSARIVGEVLGKYHPHGDSSVYDTMVRMAQEWSLRYPLVDGQGNFGSMDGDSPAAMRYTEARLRRVADEIVGDIDKETVDFQLNFDDSLEEPTVMPTKFPNLLVNGASGIAVGMATNMMPHNLSEVCDAIMAAVDKPDIDVEELMQYVKAPDFPTGGIIYGLSGVKEGFRTGRGRVVVRAKTEIETDEKGRESIIVTEVPYQVNKALLIAKIAELVNEKRILGIADVGDQSNREGVRIVIEVKRDAAANVILSQLFKLTPLQTSYGINNIALVNGRPRTLNLKDLIDEFIKFRLEVIVRRTSYELRKAEERAHILEGLLIALDHLDEVIALIRASKDAEEAREGLMSKFGLTEIQAKAILAMRLQQLTGLERDKVKLEYEELMKKIAELKAILADEGLQRGIIKSETTEIKERFGDARRTTIEVDEADISMEDLIEDEEVVITISHAGYIKRTPISEYRAQGRGGRGAQGVRTRDEDFVEHMFTATNHQTLLLFTESGRCFWLKVYEIPEGTRVGQGRVIQNLLNIPKEDKVRAFIIVKQLDDEEFINNHYIIFCTKRGQIKKTLLEAYSRPRQGGINAIEINEGDALIEAKLTNGKNEIILAVQTGKAIRFNEQDVRPMGRTAAGVRGIQVQKDDTVVGMVCIDPTDTTSSILVVSEKGMGKRSALDEYRTQGRGGKGIKTMNITAKTGHLVAIKTVTDNDDLMITTTSGVTIRTAADELRVMGRATQGVKLIRLDEGDDIADVAVVNSAEEENDPAESPAETVS
ncbi:MAG: DNA gyrase subunit A [Haliscomenobacteraceae bacterium CHB4]|nr:DNA gyrase subunit A [Saprospiraceae bacterium]MCE7922054.1 DNA gyrase subunit A [Haliscomenobacteraceae bacterium CHB4]